MDPKNIDTVNLTVTGVQADEPNVLFKGDVLIIVTQAFGPNGESLVGVSDVMFDGYPAVTVKVRVEDREALVHLSPFHGDRRKICDMEIPEGTKCELLCPVSNEPLDIVEHVEETGADYYAIYLTPRLSEGEMVVVSDIWGDYHSRIVDDFELISEWAVEEEEEE